MKNRGLCGVTQSAINQLLAKILSGKSLLEPLKPFADIDYSASGFHHDTPFILEWGHPIPETLSRRESVVELSLNFLRKLIN